MNSVHLAKMAAYMSGNKQLFYIFNRFTFNVLIVTSQLIMTSKVIMTSYGMEYRQLAFYTSLWEALKQPRKYRY